MGSVLCSPEKCLMMQKTILAAYQAAMKSQLRNGLRKIQHCIQQLDDAQIWFRPDPSMNSIANLMLHLSGNIRQWLIAGLSASIVDDRTRQQEFDDRSGRSGEVLFQELEATVEEACCQIDCQSADSLLQKRLVQEFELDGFETIADSVVHFGGHVQEIVHLTRFLLKDSYRFEFVPQNE
jgi:hypothetical protein